MVAEVEFGSSEMRKNSFILRALALAAALLTVGSLALIVAVEPVRWRTEALWRHATGDIPDVTLSELLKMMRPGTKVSFEKLFEGQTIVAVATSPFDTDEGIKAGASIFGERCVSCHGTNAGGGSGPSLRQLAAYKHGASDWAVYRNIAKGIPGSNMPSLGLSFDESWQVVSFLKSLNAINVAMSGARNNDAAELLKNYGGLSYAQLLHAGQDGDEWRTYSRTYNGWRFSPLSQINTHNVGKLRLRWVRQLTTSGTKVEASPIVVNGVMFITEPPSNVLALDAGTGRVLWTYRHPIAERLSVCCGEVNRGVAVLDDKVYVGTLDARLVALEARTGKVVWDIKLGEPRDGYSITGAPLAVHDMIITGMSGSEYGVRGFLLAVDAKTGKTRWRFNTIPGPGEPGHDTWGGDSWKTGGGSTWVTGSFDPQLNLIYWGVANPYPDFDSDARPGDNLYTNSALALDATTGRLKWHFQFTPDSATDWGANQIPILTSINLGGNDTPVIAWGNRNGFYYVLDRRDGRFITGVPFININWAKGLDGSGRPILTPAARVTTGGTLMQPGVGGATNWQPPAFNPESGLFFVHANESAGIYSKSVSKQKRRPYVQTLGGGAQWVGTHSTYVRALKVETGEKVWEYPSMLNGREWYSGLMASAGGLVFGAAAERAFALDAATGKELWSVGTGGEVWQGPVSYSDRGEQVIIFIAGRAVMAFSL